MNKHIHIHIHRTTDADGPAHAPAGSPKGGQFVSGSGGSGGGKSGGKVNRPQHSPIKSVRREQAESDVAEAKKRVGARKSASASAKLPAKDPKDMNDQELQEYLEKTNTRQTLKRG